MQNKDLTKLFNETELGLGLLEQLEQIAHELLLEDLSIRNQMTMNGILSEVNKTINSYLYVEKTIIEWEEKFQLILDKWLEKNDNFTLQEFELKTPELLHEELKK